MPDHLHGIIIITGAIEQCAAQDTAKTPPAGTNRGSLGAMIQGFKGAVAARYRLQVNDQQAPLWQRNYYERVIRGSLELINVRRYIEENPARAWKNSQVNKPL